MGFLHCCQSQKQNLFITFSFGIFQTLNIAKRLHNYYCVCVFLRLSRFDYVFLCFLTLFSQLTLNRLNVLAWELFVFAFGRTTTTTTKKTKTLKNHYISKSIYYCYWHLLIRSSELIAARYGTIGVVCSKGGHTLNLVILLNWKAISMPIFSLCVSVYDYVGQ